MMKYAMPILIVFVFWIMLTVAHGATTKGTATATVCKEIAPKVYDCGGKIIKQPKEKTR